MSTWTPARRLAAYAAVLLAVFAVGLGIGSMGADVNRSESPVHGGEHP